MWNPVTEAEVDVTDGKTDPVPRISNVADGSSLSWAITSDKAATAKLTLHAASRLRDWSALNL